MAPVSSDAELDALLTRCAAEGSKKGPRGKGGDRASWDVCVVLVTDKDKTPVAYKSLSRCVSYLTEIPLSSHGTCL